MIDEAGETADFRAERVAAGLCNPVVPASLVVEFGGPPVLGFDDQFVVDETTESAVQRSESEFHRSAGECFRGGHDAIFVCITLGEYEQDV